MFCNKYMDGCVESKTHPTLVVFSINRLASTSVTRGKKTKTLVFPLGETQTVWATHPAKTDSTWPPKISAQSFISNQSSNGHQLVKLT